MTPQNPHKEKQLLMELANGSEAAFRQVYDAYKKQVFYLALDYLQDREEAAEITQQVFVRIWEQRARMETVSSLKGYVLTIARHIVFDYLKLLARQVRMIKGSSGLEPVDAMNTEDLLQAKLINDAWSRAIDRLPGQQQQVYRLVEEQGASLDSVAALLQLTKPTVKKHLELARKHVRAEVQKQLMLKGISAGVRGGIVFLLFFS